MLFIGVLPKHFEELQQFYLTEILPCHEIILQLILQCILIQATLYNWRFEIATISCQDNMTVTESIRFPTELYQVYRQEFFARKELMLFLSERNCHRIMTVDRGELKKARRYIDGAVWGRYNVFH